MPVRIQRHLAYNYKSSSTMQHFLNRVFRLPSLLAALVGITLGAPAWAQVQPISTLMYFDGVAPQGGLISDGSAFYGASTPGGYAPGGLLYRLVPSPTSIATIYEYGRLDVWQGANPGAPMTIGSDGFLYGVTQNNSIDVLRGITTGTGTIYRVAKSGAGYTKIFEFDPYRVENQYLVNNYGALPQAALIQGFENGVGYLYGTTFRGGRNGTGTIFKIRLDGSGFKVIHHFAAAKLKTPTNPLDFDFNSDFQLRNDDGVNPNQRMVLVPNPSNPDGTQNYLYGVTRSGGVNGTGIVFRIRVDADPAPCSATTTPCVANLKSFAPFAPSPENIIDPADPFFDKLKTNSTGGYPAGGLVLAATNGMVYGTATSLGGTLNPPPGREAGYGYGTVFRVNTNAPLTDGSIEAITLFTGSIDPTGPGQVPAPGNAPAGDLIIATDGMLVGTTQAGGKLNPAIAGSPAGTVFKVQLDGTGLIQQCIFIAESGGTLGAGPQMGVIQYGTDGGFYGVASQGGYGFGLVFKCGPATGTEPVGIRPPLKSGGGMLSLWMIAIMGTLLGIQTVRRSGRRA